MPLKESRNGYWWLGLVFTAFFAWLTVSTWIESWYDVGPVAIAECWYLLKGTLVSIDGDQCWDLVGNWVPLVVLALLTVSCAWATYKVWAGRD